MASLLGRALTLLRAPANELSFGLRSRLGWSRGLATLPHEGKQDLFGHVDPEEAAELQRDADELRERFGLGALHGCSTRLAYAANLALIDRLIALCGERTVPAGVDGKVRAVDIGCGDFHYATALASWLSRHDATGASGARDVVLRGIEVDAHGIYRDGHSRADHGRAHAALASGGRADVCFEVADCCALRLPEQDVVTCFYPFVSAYALLRWGLPLTKLRPRLLLHRAASTLRPGGWLVVANQTGAEFERLVELLRDAPVTLLGIAPFASDFVPYAAATADRVGSVWQRS